MSTAKKTCDRYGDLLLSRHVLKDISKSDDAALTRHLGICAACRRQERQLLALHAASRALPELKTSGAFERRLFRELAIPRHDRPERTAGPLSRLLALFDAAGSRLKPLAAFCTVLLVQVVLLRAYFLPVRHDSRPAPTQIEARKEPASPLDARFGAILTANNLRGSVTSEVRTVRLPLPAPRTLPARRSLTTTDRLQNPPFGYTPSMTDRKTAESRTLYKKAPDKNGDAVPPRDALDKQKTDTDSRRKDETVKNKQLQRGTDQEDRSTAGGSAAGSMDKSMPKKSSPGGDAPDSSDNRLSKKSNQDTSKQATPPRIAQGKVLNGLGGRLRGTATIGRSAAPARPPQEAPRFRTEHRVTLNLIVPPEQEKTVSRLTPLFSREVRSRYGEGSKVALNITTLPAPATQPEDNRAPWALLLVLVLEGTVRVLLFLFLKKSGRLTTGTGCIALLLGTLSVPWFLLRRTRPG